jgi:hypothetical protein
MALPITIPYTFGNSTSAIPLANLDSDFTTLTNAINGLGNGTVSFISITSAGNATFNTTGYVQLPAGTTAQRTGSPVAGMIRYNSDTGSFEGYSSSGWSAIGVGATGGGSDHVFFVNAQTVTTNYSIPSGDSAMSTGPITVNSGVTITVPSGSKWVVL